MGKSIQSLDQMEALLGTRQNVTEILRLSTSSPPNTSYSPGTNPWLLIEVPPWLNGSRHCTASTRGLRQHPS
jgi:hypothetical protein